jgi:hypothetical protein
MTPNWERPPVTSSELLVQPSRPLAQVIVSVEWFATLEGGGDLDDKGAGALAFGVGDLGFEVETLDALERTGVFDHRGLGLGDDVGCGQRAGCGGIGGEERGTEREEGEEGANRSHRKVDVGGGGTVGKPPQKLKTPGFEAFMGE